MHNRMVGSIGGWLSMALIFCLLGVQTNSVNAMLFVMELLVPSLLYLPTIINSPTSPPLFIKANLVMSDVIYILGLIAGCANVFQHGNYLNWGQIVFSITGLGCSGMVWLAVRK
ncbi:hypothetical protein PWH42_03385 [Pediococcus acidilactici]|uniref:hypothetical protein n=1 Tax=Pediococcus acidilactici TaxID=1254 RepID=UPI00237C0369|nr:hypothetical protein [Pediococcus acidilactici]MDD9323049.1 hypothetical protein [Pediococcus acidilactici]